MLKEILGLLILTRIIVATIRTAFISLSRIELRQLVEKYPKLPLEQGILFQLTISLVAEILLLSVAAVWILLFRSLAGSYELWEMIGGILVYLLVEKIIVSTLAFLNREWILSHFFLFLFPFYFLFSLIVLPASFIAGKLLRIENEREEDEEDRESEEKAFIDVATEQGIIEEEEKELIQGILDFGDTLVKEIMTPRTEIVGVEQSVSYRELMAVFCSAKHSRMPVFRKTMDDIIGVVHLKDVVATKPETFKLSNFLQQPFYVPETKKVDDLLREMQAARTKMAVVLDEYGGTAGIVTIEDLMEEIVGEIEDEHDSHSEEIKCLDDGVFLVDGRCNLEDLKEETGIDLDIEEIDTVGGAVFSIFGRIPDEGDSLQWKKLKLTVEKMKRRRVQVVRIETIKTDENV